MSGCCSGEPVRSTLTVAPSSGVCAMGEKTGTENERRGRIPVLSCEGACIRGEIARLAANEVARRGNFRRCCHGELFTVPDSAMAHWAKTAPKVICIDGCFLKCHSRILENLVDPSGLAVFDALSRHQKYNELFDIDDVPEDERKLVARDVAEWVVSCVESGELPERGGSVSCGCCSDS